MCRSRSCSKIHHQTPANSLQFRDVAVFRSETTRLDARGAAAHAWRTICWPIRRCSKKQGANSLPARKIKNPSCSLPPFLTGRVDAALFTGKGRVAYPISTRGETSPLSRRGSPLELDIGLGLRICRASGVGANRIDSLLMVFRLEVFFDEQRRA